MGTIQWTLESQSAPAVGRGPCSAATVVVGPAPVVQWEGGGGGASSDRPRGRMLVSRTTGSSSVVPELVYADVAAAIDWLCGTFGFTEIWRADAHRARLAYGNGVVIIADEDPVYGRVAPSEDGARKLLRHGKSRRCRRTPRAGAAARRSILRPPADYPYGERQYSAQDLAGHRWTFTQALADLAPEDWGGTSARA